MPRSPKASWRGPHAQDRRCRKGPGGGGGQSRQIYRTPRHNHAAIELHAVTVAWEDKTLTVHDTTQMVNLTQSTFAKMFGITESQVRILSPFVGGGFGNKGVWTHHFLAVGAAQDDAPGAACTDPEGVFRATGGRTLTDQRVAWASTRTGNARGIDPYRLCRHDQSQQLPRQFSFPARHLYAAENILVSQKIVELDMVANTFMRAPGESVGTFALECALDELADSLISIPSNCGHGLSPRTDPTSGFRIFIPPHRGSRITGGRKRSVGPAATLNREPIATVTGWLGMVWRLRHILLPHARRIGAHSLDHGRPSIGLDGQP